ncbi:MULTISPECIES: L-glutamate gamma-semialdehyde dehydrogenase [unclassified Paenibacillus]|uniref:L-glutamate gamma-semialdehyde dehydrogenase n=1 Tax=unclassified Paenibacillus TaxID=185978 RepID=UPI001AE6B442|nr:MULTISPECIES: L-glutamate gamma-semialdehyde dehydrogenase [unclassified Paenibacillus]MBP1156170.1 1-pyrroline-5-carboxylate dehydrogenase [Paenibacillus sp. PvP091]MBP1168444.1 1-pyrroline-5-carboxylate dehydrogenase [Paenibacillus sp. PvR098]MBP2439472.1 1-pyrroline-5-carboxylate dehydrogenase [Paenibacillus sp. PvP052]
MVEPFRNEPFTDFTQSGNREVLAAALERVEAQLGQEYSLRIGAERLLTDRKADSVDPADPTRVIGTVSQADQALAEKAILAAAHAFTSWKSVPPAVRARYLYKTAELLRSRKAEFSAWMVVEAGKSWAEADADTAEAIDFLEFYGREAERLSERQPLTHIPGEDNELTYIPLGVGIVIPPWNFPLAIMAGMTSAAVAAGNTVVLKPASATPVIAAKFMEMLDMAGLPDGVVNFLPGSGQEVGDVLVEHPLTRFVSFTGSREVGLRINERAAKTAPGQRWIKRVVAEMGGKDAIIVDSDCDLELAAEAITASAFGFAGQKCSACSRAIVHESVYDEVLRRVAERVSRLRVGDPSDPEMDVGPVIDAKAHRKILEYLEIGRMEGRVVCGGRAGNAKGYYIEPTIIADVDSKARIAQEEIFGPVVAFIKASSFDQALELANDTEYGLTGAVITRNRAHLERARSEFHVGNLYFNRKCTGALVGVHPFGGFNMSGTDSKAGGRDYLLQFTQAKVVSERF